MRREQKGLHELSAQYDLDDPNPEAMVARAKAKYQEILEGRVVTAPAGWFWGRVTLFTIFLILPSVALGLGALFASLEAAEDGARGVYVIAVVLSLPALLLFIAGTIGILGCRATTPKRALRLFYRLVGNGRYSGAQMLVVPNDFDNYPRFFPEEHDLQGIPSTNPLFFDAFLEFREYWRALLRWKRAPYCLTSVKALQVEEVTPDLVICDFLLYAGTNTRLWLLLIPIGLIPAAIVDAVTRVPVTREMTKVLVRVEDEWHLFNGAWCEHDEADLSWLPEKAEA
jgi:hypothetical protein